MKKVRIENSRYSIKKTKMRLRKKVIIVFVTAILVITIPLLLIAIFLKDNIRTIFSIEKISDAPAYQMSYYGDYALEKYMKHGAANGEEFQAFLTNNLAKGAGKLFSGEHGCSAFFGVTPDGDFILARNFDTSIGEGCILKTDDTEGSKILAMSNIGWIMNKSKDELTFTDKLKTIASPYMVTDGINEYGLTVALFTASGSQSIVDKSKITLYDNSVPIVLLNKAKTVDEAISLLSKYNVSLSNYPSQYMVCDASGNSAVIEFVNGDMQVVRKDGNYQICSNFILYNNPSLDGFGSDRYKNYDDVLAQTKGVLSISDALKLLQKNTIPGDEQWSVVYNLTDKTISATFYGNYDKVYEYSFK